MTTHLVATTSKTIQAQMAPPPVPLASKPKPKAKSFAQAVKANISQQTPRFAPASSHEDFLRLLQLKEVFPNLPQAIIISIYQASLGSANASQESSSHPGVSRTLKMMTQGPTRHQVLVPLDSAATETMVANAASAVQFYNKGLVEACSKLRVESVRKAWDGMSMSTNSITSAAELDVIKQWLKKTAELGESTEVEPCLPQSKSFLKILGVPYWDSKSSLPITRAQVEAALSNSLLFEGVSLASMPCIMKASPSSDMSVIWIDIWDSQKGSKVRLSLTGHSTLGIILLQSGRLLCTLGLLSVAIAGAGVTLHIPVVLKVLNVRNVVVLIELRTTDCWLSVARPIPSLTL